MTEMQRTNLILGNLMRNIANCKTPKEAFDKLKGHDLIFSACAVRKHFGLNSDELYDEIKAWQGA